MVTILWRDIPAQVNAGSGADRSQRILPRRFQKAIDRAAMVAGTTHASEYVAEWRRVASDFSGDPDAAAVAEAERIEAEFPLERLNEYVATGGWNPDNHQTDRPPTPEPTLGATEESSP